MMLNLRENGTTIVSSHECHIVEKSSASWPWQGVLNSMNGYFFIYGGFEKMYKSVYNPNSYDGVFCFSSVFNGYLSKVPPIFQEFEKSELILCRYVGNIKCTPRGHLGVTLWKGCYMACLNLQDKLFRDNSNVTIWNREQRVASQM